MVSPTHILHIGRHLDACPFDERHLRAVMRLLGDDLGLDPRAMHGLVRLLVTCRDVGPDFYPLLVVLGRARVLDRLAAWYDRLSHV